MPSIEAPTHYEHSKGIMPSRFDNFFKWLSPTFYIAETGDAESPLGWVCLIEVTDKDIVDWYESQGMSLEEMRQHMGLDEYPIDSGFYITRQDDNGLIWAMAYGTGTLAQEGARADFAEAEKVYEAWLSLEEEEPTTRENEMELYIDTVTGTWGEAVDLRIVTAKSNLDEVLDTMSDDEVTKVGLSDGRPIDQYIANQGTANAEKMFLVCKNCGEAFDTLQTAHEHGTFISGPDPSWCGEDGFDLVPESDAF